MAYVDEIYTVASVDLWNVVTSNISGVVWL
jgi:hypothetical protein